MRLVRVCMGAFCASPPLFAPANTATSPEVGICALIHSQSFPATCVPSTAIHLGHAQRLSFLLHEYSDVDICVVSEVLVVLVVLRFLVVLRSFQRGTLAQSILRRIFSPCWWLQCCNTTPSWSQTCGRFTNSATWIYAPFLGSSPPRAPFSTGFRLTRPIGREYTTRTAVLNAPPLISKHQLLPSSPLSFRASIACLSWRVSHLDIHTCCVLVVVIQHYSAPSTGAPFPLHFQFCLRSPAAGRHEYAYSARPRAACMPGHIWQVARRLSPAVASPADLAGGWRKIPTSARVLAV
ncbi:hypothetical protein HYPSUDRAFT_423484 [Hypholoma sublateritium FD-334 SS-4]|uniref:Uncharacterized protein n=1 Tax=Hypholoma sublateritium (strain FD-334 SS-4) TaxID=945553 RepID=A0A0D2LD76_HYPSF|nr:hypothetical protein HYPSUDRAFT_423484 [Hypholoma sublateritium FD-334 SS-4]